ncbi:MAG: SDR family NAD(P)-dependent oxidoreductase [Giesbergeria sp.]|uniref:SDR family NAD(P)-dependent oxidoreductase n=1 Tax=Giesbergeria sp. TaxID=2818473 RepID=UPI00261C7EF4|nr:SDR family oxidoreductase [Giesbergeria sp.]MDD2609018.1 SDR family NAD(P)-dependent oxidoreductase [Giesbergeria sp.]
MHIHLSGKTAIITGASAGIGLAIARGLAQAGASVTLCARDAQRLNAAVAALQAEGLQAQGVAADLASAAGCQALIAAVPQTDILVNNLGIYGTQDFFAISDENWETFFLTNVMSGLRLSRHYAQGMKARGWGRIQFISSESAVNIPADMVHYGVSKSALQGLSRGLAKVLAGTGVTVNTILPGPTRTAGVETFFTNLAREQGISVPEMEQRFFRENRPSSLIGRFATPEEVANLCVYAASTQASATTGAALRVEGGIVESII